VRTGHESDLTVWDLLQGGDDVARLAGEESGPDAWVEVGEWPRTRLTAALVAAIGALAGDHDDREPGHDGPRADGSGHFASGLAGADAPPGRCP
jgi:hypothetical protein